MTRIVTTTYRYKPPPKKRKAVAIAGPAIVRKAKPGPHPEAEHLPTAGTKPTIVTARRRGKRNADVPNMTPEEFQRRVDAADALWLELVRVVTSKDRP
jgi:hypothetical protein